MRAKADTYMQKKMCTKAGVIVIWGIVQEEWQTWKSVDDNR